VNDVAAVHLVDDVEEMNCEDDDEPFLQLLATSLARVHQILPHTITHLEMI